MNNNLLKALVATVSLLSLHPAKSFTQVLQTGSIGGASPDPKLAPGGTASNLNSISSPNLFTGAMTINIPIHGYALNGQDYGISLSYNTKGIRVDQCAMPAGLGWNTTEGTIVRVVRDLPDELNMVTPTMIELEDTSFVNKNRLLKGKFVTYTESPEQLAEPNVYRDGECDDFIFSCGGQSFTFNLGKDLKVFTHPHRNVKISTMIDGVAVFGVPGQPAGPWGTSQSDNLLEFLITDEGGTKYYFVRGDFEEREMYTNEYYESDNMGTSYPTTRWVVKKIVFPSGSEINYTYSSPQYSGTLKNYKQFYVREQWSSSNPVSADFIFPAEVPARQRTTRLLSIQYPDNSTASFVYDPVERTELSEPLLKEVQIASGGNCIRYKLNQSQINNRWFLNSVKMASCDGSVEQRYYSFDYNPLPLPDRLSPAQDFFGYYNGSPDGQAIGASGTGINIPKHHDALSGGPLSYMNYGSPRYSSAIHAQAGILTKVSNAYGGEISYRYSLNNYYPMMATSGIQLPVPSQGFVGETAADGLRVDSVIEKELFHPENTKVTTYQYLDVQSFLIGGFVHYPEYADSATGHWNKRIFQNMFLTPHQMICGSNQGYSRVITRTYAAGQLLSRRDMTFTNMSDSTSNNQIRYYTTGKHYFEYPYTDKSYLKDWEIGLPLTITDYDQNERIAKQTFNYYDFSPVTLGTDFPNRKTAKVQSGHAITIQTFGDPVAYYPNKKIYTDDYYPFTGKASLRCSKVRNYVSDTRYSEDSIVYTYDNHDNIRSTTAHNSVGEKIKTTYVYNYDVGGSAVTGGAAPGSTLYNMTETGLEKVVSIEKWKSATGIPGTESLLDASITTYSYQGGVLRNKGAMGLATLDPIPSAVYTAGSTGNPYSRVIEAFAGQTPVGYQKMTEVMLTDTRGNPLETRLMDMESYKSMIWDTLTGKLITEVANARYADIAFSGFDASVKGNLNYNTADISLSSVVPGGGISGDHVLKVQSWNTSPLSHNGLTPGKEYTLTFWCNGGTPQFEGAGLGQIPLVNTYTQNGWVLYSAKFTPANNSSLGFTQTGSPGSPFTYYLDDVRIYPTVATMTTANYTPLFGINSTSDAQSRMTYYEFDKLGRKTLTRDQERNIILKTKYYNGGGL